MINERSQMQFDGPWPISTQSGIASAKKAVVISSAYKLEMASLELPDKWSIFLKNLSREYQPN